MSVAFCTDDSCVTKISSTTVPGKPTNPNEVARNYDIDRSAKWIARNKLSRVALQFCDSLLADSTAVVQLLQLQTSAEIFILADTSYGSCCVDEVAAGHYNADGIIHYGASCLSPTQRLPLLHVFTYQQIDVNACCQSFQRIMDDPDKPILLIYDVVYHQQKDAILRHLHKYYKHIVNGELKIPDRDKPTQLDDSDLSEEPTQNTQKESLKSPSKSHSPEEGKIIRQFGRCFCLHREQELEKFVVFYIGAEGMALTNWMLYLKDNVFYLYSPQSMECRQLSVNVNKHLMKRYFLIEKAKDAQIVGLLVGTLGVTEYLESFKRMKKLCAVAGKKTYTFVVGKLNPAKLANFLEVDIYVLVACPQNSLVNCSEFYRPVITPYELELACNPDREWTGKLVMDFRNLLPGGENFVKEPDELVGRLDISLITGAVRQLGIRDEAGDSWDHSIANQNLQVSTLPSAGDALAERSWQGLEEKLGQVPVEKAKHGRKGIAMGYREEQCLTQDKK